MSGGATLIADFRSRYGGTPRLFRAPARINVIGEHTDYNDGFVLPAAIQYETMLAIRPRSDRVLRLHSQTNGKSAEFDLVAESPPRHDWADYAFGVAVMLQRGGMRLPGADILVTSSIPMGAGLSSSAALEVATGYGLLALAGVPVDKVALARLCQRAENDHVGMRCGIMDQFICCNGLRDHALLIDIRSLESRSVPLDPRLRLVVANSMVHHSLAGSEYNKRRASCEEGVRLLASALGPIAALRDVTREMLESNRRLLPEETYRRCRHIITENARVIAAGKAFEAEEWETVGHLMDESHVSMRDDYEITCPEVDGLVAIARKQPGVLGTRMTGGGFGGCTVSLVEEGEVESFIATVGAAYEKATGLKAQIFACTPSEGAGPLDLT